MGAVRVKRRSASGASGAPSALKSGELAFNEKDQMFYYGFGDDGAGNATSAIAIAGKGAFVDLASAQTIGGQKAFTLVPTAPDAPAGDATQKLATTNFVQQALGAVGGQQAPNTFYAGPASGSSNAAPTYRKITAADLPASVTGGLNYVGTLPATGSLPANPQKGQYWIISTAGTFTGTTHAFLTGDWLVANGSSSDGDVAPGFDFVDNSVRVSSIFGRMGAVVAALGDYTTDLVSEGANLYFTGARVLATVIGTLPTPTNAALAATDTLIQALAKIQGQLNARLQSANNLSDLGNVATARNNLGLGTMATQNANAINATGGSLDSVTITNSSFDAGTY